MKTFFGRSALLALLVSLAGVGATQTLGNAAPKDIPSPALSAAALLEHTRILSSDEFEGRAPGGKGEAMTVAYITQQFKALGLAPGNPDGSYVQRVPMLGSLATPSLSFSTGNNVIALRPAEDFVAISALQESAVTVDNSELVFVGYGVVAPQYGWDDYKGMDLRGKTLVMLINDPPIPDRARPGELDAAMFGGKALTYYGRWTYKYEMAARLGAAAAIIVHETGPALASFDGLRRDWSREKLFLRTGGTNPDYPSLASWITLDRAKELFAASGKDFDSLKAAALSKDFRPVRMGSTASLKVQNAQRVLETHNVVARVEGSDPVLKDEYIIYSAHWDHLGINEKLPGPRTNQIYHGALDNAAGVATLIEIARAYKALPVPPKRTILFMATTAEEHNLAGARYYALNPLYPLHKTLVNINIDVVNPYGRTSDVSIIGSGKSDTDDVVARIATRQGRTVAPEFFTENGVFYRSDQFEFARAGIPAVWMRPGVAFIDKPADFAIGKRIEYYTRRYHNVQDVIGPDWDLSGAVEDAQLLFGVGYDLAQGTAFPSWRPGAEFKRPAAPR